MKLKIPFAFTLIAIICCTSFAVQAKKSHYSPNIFVKNESHSQDNILSIGFEVPLGDQYSAFKAFASTALAFAEVTDNNSNQQKFISFDSGIKFGYFSDFSLYGEVGIDLFELAFNKNKDDDEDDLHYSNKDFERERHSDNEIDGYVGIGVSYNLKPLTVGVFTRVRQIDSRNWQVKEHVYSGLQLSVSF